MKHTNLIINRIGYLWMMFVGAFFLSVPLKAQDISTLIPQIKDAVFTVYAEDENKQVYASGSGFFVSSTGVGITNFHVLQGASGGHITCADGTEFRIKHIIDYNPEYDIIKFQVSPVNGYIFKSLQIQSQLPLQGEFIVNYSNPLGTYANTVSTGIVSAIREYKGYEKVLQITAPISHGSSGSPVMNKQGEVVGIATFGNEEGQSLNFAVSILQLQKMTRSLSLPIADMQKNPKETEMIKRGQTLALQGQYKDAFEMFDRAIQLDSLNYLAYFYRGLWHCRTEGDLAGIADLMEACSLDTMCYDCFLKTGEYLKNAMIKIHDNLNEIPDPFIGQAILCYNRCIELDPNRPETYGDFGYMLLHVASNRQQPQLLETSLGLLNICIELLPTSAIYYLYRAEVYKDMKDYGRALIDCDKAIEINRNYWRPYFIKGIIQSQKLGQYEEGILTYLRAESLAPNDEYKAQVQGFIGDAYANKYMYGQNKNIKDLRMALNYYEKAYQIQPSPINKHNIDYVRMMLQAL